MKPITRCEILNEGRRVVRAGNVDLLVTGAANQLSHGSFFPDDWPVNVPLEEEAAFLKMEDGKIIQICDFEKTKSGGNYFNFYFQE
ncbi:MAG: hypothetical protein ABSH11_02350 [Verrucomicrobiota bacterium]|jgi:hypothetical protein